MIKSNYNDYELIYLIRNGNEIALDILLKKYNNLIYKKIIDFKVYNCDFDDFFQEGLMILNNAVSEFSEEYNKSFTRFFELLLIRRFIRLRGNSYYKNKYYFLNESLIDKLEGNISEKRSIDYYINKEKNYLSKLENIILQEYFLNSLSVKVISEKYNVDVKKIYNTISRVKNKLKKNNIKH